LSRYLRVSARQVWRLSKKKLLPAPICIGERIVRWNASEIAAWLQAGSPPRAAWEKQRTTQTAGVENT
ncbi:MAG: AlpA family phage regulatory protein, partial [Planctomycetes bacterium]|nr:AlpA family phage regulatory protein [Planctomycetota bacterium]